MSDQERQLVAALAQWEAPRGARAEPLAPPTNTGLGAHCSRSTDCSSGFCADGYCCNTACTGMCQSCARAKTGVSDGTCASVKGGTDPDGECIDGQSCSMDNCNSGGCVHEVTTGCMIGHSCVPAGAVDPANECRFCNPVLDTGAYSNEPRGVPCHDDGQANTDDYCDGLGACIHPLRGQCMISGQVYNSGAANPGNPCLACDPATSISSWTSRVSGFPCSTDGLSCTLDVCDGAGTCQHNLFAGCLIGSACVAAGSNSPSNECKQCDPAASTTGYTNKARGLACTDDGLPNTDDYCDGAGACIHPLKGECLIGGLLFPSGADNPDNACQVCDPVTRIDAWTSRVANYPCSTDGLSCTSDVCDGAGVCRHSLYAGCLIGGACVATGADNPAQECTQCDPALSTGAYSNRARGEPCTDDGLSNTDDFCDGAGRCIHPLRGACTIAGQEFPTGAANPANACEQCDPASSTSAWTTRVAGFPCGSDSLSCTSDVCDGAGACLHSLFTGCLIAGACVAAGAANPDNACQECNPMLSTSAYSDRARGVSCPDDGLPTTDDLCDGAGTCIHPPNGTCFVAGHSYASGAANPDNACQDCEPSVRPDGWADRVWGFPCGSDGLSCTADACNGAGGCEHLLFTGCLIGGACVPAGATDPSNDCRECNPSMATGSWSAKVRGVACTDDGTPATDDVCDGSGTCTHPPNGTCFIDNQVVASGAANPANGCQSCEPAVSAEHWTNRVVGFPCGSDSLECTDDVCGGAGQCLHTLARGCLIGNQCIPASTVNPANDCQECNPALSTSGWSAKVRGVACADDGHPYTDDTCNGTGTCTHPGNGTCFIRGESFPGGAANPDNPCQNCDATVHPDAWTDRVAGFPCTSDGLSCTSDACSGAGVCEHTLFRGCLIDGSCVAAGARDPAHDCRECNPVLSTTSYTNRAQGVACTDDGHPYTADVCDADGACTHPGNGTCFISGQAYAGGAANPDNPCQSCDASVHPDAWTDRVAGFPCTSDGLSCTADSCNATGRCLHSLVNGCLIDNACVAAGTLDPTNPCRECNPALSTSAYSSRSSGVSCPDDGHAYTDDVCDGAGTCTHPSNGTCFIDGRSVPGGAANPANACQGCDPDTRPDGWTHRIPGFPCGSDGLDCTVDACDGQGTCTHALGGGCVINGQCVAAGQAEPGVECHLCNPAESTSRYSNAANGSACGDDGLGCTLDTCQAGSCRHDLVAGCLVNGACVADQSADPANECRLCVPANSRGTYWDAARGLPCTDDGLPYTLDICDGAGACIHPDTGTCIIDSKVYMGGTANPDNGCLLCDPATSHQAWTRQPAGFPCNADGLTCTQDRCDGAGSCEHPLVSGCLVDGACVSAGSPDPANPCRECNPAVSTVAYSNRPDGVACGADGLDCTQDLCLAGQCRHPLFAGCLVDGACVLAGAVDPGNVCLECNPVLSTTAYSPRARGVACTDDGLAYTVDACDGAGTCTHQDTGTCIINGVAVSAGTANPDNACQSCDPLGSRVGWTDRTRGFPCAADELGCTWDACDGAGSCQHTLFTGCLVDGQCVGTGSLDPENACRQCNPAASTSEYVNVADGTSCAADGLECTADQCRAGSCEHPLVSGCLVNGQCVAAGVADPQNECRECNPALSTGEFSNRPHGVACADDGREQTLDVCDGLGTCIHPALGTCTINTVDYAAGAANPANPCQECNPQVTPRAWTHRVNGYPCGADGLTCTSDVCNGAGQCEHPLVSGCLIDNACVPAGAADPANVCAECNPSVSTRSYSPKGDGAACTSDGLECTRDACGNGVCQHLLLSGCLVDGACVATGAQDPAAECRACIPAVSSTGYTSRARGVACTDDGLPYTQDLCDGAGTCIHPELEFCTVGGTSYPAGGANPENACQQCDPRSNTRGWTNRSSGFPCADDGLACTQDVCNGGGLCEHRLFTGCVIDGTCIAAGTLDPASACRECQPQRSTTEFTDRPEGATCPGDGLECTADVCRTGSCQHVLGAGCIIQGACVPLGTQDPGNACRECNPQASASSWTDRPAGSPCGDDGNPGTLDRCDGQGTCTHPSVSACIIERVEYAAGAAHPQNPCKECNPVEHLDSWTDRAAGNRCTEDGLECTADVCDGYGACTHPVYSGCLVDGECVKEDASPEGNTCLVCAPQQSRDRYVPRPDGTFCYANGTDYAAGSCVGGQCVAQELPDAGVTGADAGESTGPDAGRADAGDGTGNQPTGQVDPVPGDDNSRDKREACGCTAVSAELPAQELLLGGLLVARHLIRRRRPA